MKVMGRRSDRARAPPKSSSPLFYVPLLDLVVVSDLSRSLDICRFLLPIGIDPFVFLHLGLGPDTALTQTDTVGAAWFGCTAP